MPDLLSSGDPHGVVSTCTCEWVSMWKAVDLRPGDQRMLESLGGFWDLSYRKRDPECPQHGNAVIFDPIRNAIAAMRILRDRRTCSAWIDEGALSSENASMDDLRNGLTVGVAYELQHRLQALGVDEKLARRFIGDLAEAAVEGVVKVWTEGRQEPGGTPMPQSKDEWEAHCAFYRLTVDQRNRAWDEIRSLKHAVKVEAEGLLELAEEG